ncbi:electron transport complex subunit RsxC [Vibrio amylolyticus]|uniref:electron transport complex subunit RsxC n=1 Tax=Vibrio amylolyticus TaxID=2847292 RepID=UPI00354ADFBF
MNSPSLIEQIKTGALWDFHGGIHPPENKSQSNELPPVQAAMPQELVLPIKQHIGKPGDLIVKSGDTIKKGQPLTQYNTSMMLPVHAPTSGVITAIEPRTTNHPSGYSELCIVIAPDNLDAWYEKQSIADFQQESAETLMEHIRLAGISGMGGAGFPTAKKIQSGLSKTELLIINAAECEPYITADDVLMQHYADEIITGIEIVERILSPKLTIIAIEDNKPTAIKALELAAKDKDIVIRVIPTKFPSGGEKQLIKLLTNQEVPRGGIPADIGMLVQNVASMFAIKRAVCDGEPLIQRIVTLTGDQFAQPRNVWALVGTPISALLEEFGYNALKRKPRVIMGGPMMGFTLPHANIPVTKTSNCIIAPSKKELPDNQHEMACIRCGQCAEVCPSTLLPQQLQWHAKAQEYDKCTELNLQDCIECGACAYVCPSEIPLVQYYRQAKAEIRAQKEEAQSAERARQRFEEKNARLERAKAERENRFKKAADNRRSDMTKKGGDDAVAAAIARVKAQKQSAQSEQQEPSTKPAVAAAIARAKAKQAEAQEKNQTGKPDNSEMMRLRAERKNKIREQKALEQSDQLIEDPIQSNAGKETSPIDPKKAAIAEAIARAKARKAKQNQASDEPETDASSEKSAKPKAAAQTETEQESTPSDPKKAAVAAAIARAKARKANQNQASDEPTTVTSSEDTAKSKAAEHIEAEQDSTPSDPKKAAVAAAIARAKARKAKQNQTPDVPETAVSNEETDKTKADAQVEAEQDSTPTDPKKVAVAAAIARAKARKAKQNQTSGEPETDASSEETDKTKADEQVEAEQDSTPSDPKKAAVAAAIARAKARKAKQNQASDEPETDALTEETAKTKADAQVETEQESTPSDPKKAAVAAAIARAKARKAKQTALTQNDTEENQ